MALSIASKGTGTSTSNPIASSSFTPSAAAVLVVAFCSFPSAAGTASISDTFGDTGGGSWTAFTGSSLTTGGTFGFGWGGWSRLIGTSPGAATVSISTSGWTGGQYSFCLDQVTTSAGTLSVPQSKVTAANFSTTGSAVLGSSPAASSLVWGGAVCEATALSPVPSTGGFTNLDNINTGSSTSAATSYINGSGPATTAWSGLSGAQNNAVMSVEIAVTGGAAGVPDLAMAPLRGN